MVLPAFIKNKERGFIMSMKTILGVFVLTFVALLYAAAPTNTLTDANYEWGVARALSSAANSDTILTDGDSTIIVDDFVPERNRQYIYVRDANTGTGSDSSYYQILVRCKTGVGGATLYSVAVDTVTAAAGEAILLPFGETLFGNAFKIVAKGLSGSTGVQVIINREYLFERKAVGIKKEWR
jgi:hypothetical protein